MTPLNAAFAHVFEFLFDIALHYFRLCAFACILGAFLVSIGQAILVTPHRDAIEPITAIFPALASGEERFHLGKVHSPFSFPITVGLPVIRRFWLVFLFVPFAMGICEQFAGRQLFGGKNHYKFWCWLLGAVFATTAVVTIAFDDVYGYLVAYQLNLYLLGTAFAGVFVLHVISRVRQWIIEKITGAEQAAPS